MIQNAPVASEHAQLYTPDLTVPILGLTCGIGGRCGISSPHVSLCEPSFTVPHSF